jgi:mRNA-degrading endonuclease RelE of RelBE toxin-antitoxin system
LATKIVIPDTLIKRLNDLPKEIRIKFWEQIEKLIMNPSYPGLRNEKLAGTNQWAFSITMNYRATYIRGESSIIITGVGTHKEILGS